MNILLKEGAITPKERERRPSEAAINTEGNVSLFHGGFTG
jgi:hypothetical protein